VATRAFFTTRHGGVSIGPFRSAHRGRHGGDDPAAVAQNRARTAELAGVERLVFMHQVHGRDVAAVGAGSTEEIADVDALVSDVPQVALAVLVADCVPLLLCAERAVAAVHVGRRGLAAGVVARALQELRMLDESAVTASVGPCVCGGCYEVPVAMQEDVCAVVPAARGTTRRGTAGLDLRAGVESQLRAAGVDHIRHERACTVESPDLFSYRRDGTTGRFAGLAVVDP
jgi:YfiH family protein